MKVFLSWSGPRSKAVAELLDDWIQCVLQAVKPWMSARDIDRGSLWFTEINDQLKEVTTGIVCLTKENKDRPWILFESGALARGLSSQRVMTFLVDLSPTDIGDPLAQFNHTIPDEAGLRSLVTSINTRLGELAISSRTLDSVFETYWPQFKARFEKIIDELPEVPHLPERTEENKIDEVLAHVRGMDRRLRQLEFDQKQLFNRRTGEALLKSGRDNDMDASHDKDLMLAIANKAVRSMKKHNQDLKEFLTQCDSAGIPRNIVDLALCGVTSPLEFEVS